MAAIDDRARDLNQSLARPDDEYDQDDEDQGDDVDQDDEDEQSEDQDDEDQDEDTRGPRTRAAAEGGPALSAGLVLGFLAYSAAIQIFRGGTAQLSGWLKAKFINEPMSAPANGKSAGQGHK